MPYASTSFQGGSCLLASARIRALPFLYQSHGQLTQVVDTTLKTLPFLYQKSGFGW
jgi:hypothetical protein